MKSVVIVLGPTASGKTALSIALARDLRGEIISADSMQIYRYMDIGTAKPSTEEMHGIKHYLIDAVNPDEEFSVAKYQELAYGYMEEIHARNKLPIVVGGTGLYINSLVYNINFSETVSDWEFRARLKKEAEENGNECLHHRLREIDPEAADRIHANDIKRVIRALEVYEYTKKPISYHQEISRREPAKYKYILIGLKMDREKLYEKINKRVDFMIENGLAEEVKKLVGMGYGRNAVAMQGLGYKEMLAYIRGEITLDDAIYLIKRDTRRYAKRQITWFKRLEGIHWVDTDVYPDSDGMFKNIKDYIASSGIFL